MAEREAQIRRFQASDEKLVRFSIGKAAMEPLAVANRRAYVHPIPVAIWALFSYAIITYMDLWPKTSMGFVGYLQPLPMMAATSLPIMFLIDWLNRPAFETAAQEVLRGPDMGNILTHYTRNPASGLWILEYGRLFVGLIALDVTSESTTKGGKKSPKGVSSAIVRHFYVDEVYRGSGIQEDLLAHALRTAFSAEPNLKVVHATDSQLLPYARNCLRDAGFVLEENTKTIGVFRWKLGKRTLSREEWEKKNNPVWNPTASLYILGDVSFLPNVEIFDWLASIPGYDGEWIDPREKILAAVSRAPPGSIQIIIDSVDTLCSDIGSISETYKFLFELLGLVNARPNPSRLVVHTTRPSKIVSLLIQPSFSPSLVQLTAHPVALLRHLAKDYLTPPPPSSSETKFWSAFLPLSERTHDVERLIFGSGLDGEGTGGVNEIVVEVLVRSSEGRKRGVERELEGWSLKSTSPCDLTKFERLKGVWTQNAITEMVDWYVQTGPDPTQNVSFNLNLTASQQESRAQVPLPYAHEGNSSTRTAHGNAAAILYDPDSADDIDDDDPDEDLDI
ncbi:hypothetical protein H0H92_002601 [Tricholoma furcatifolium]|nr:hypothetical protein H0H92_002601 [Tricholoma furcatifolium]